MLPLISDLDLLLWEPNILSDAASVAQPLLRGEGDLSDTTFTLTAGTITDFNVAPGHVILLSGTVNGSFVVTAVNSPTELSLTVLYEQVSDEIETTIPNSPGSGTALSFSVSTFWPHRLAASERMMLDAGLQPSDSSKILNPGALRRPGVLATLHQIYLALSASGEDAEFHLSRATFYERLYLRALRTVTLEIDHDGDGALDERRSLSILPMRRA
jgi:hypothetical protein